MKLNELLKKYRTEQNKTQKQWAQDVVSPSFYAKVEKNLSRISAEDLIDLLRQNNIPTPDFFGKLNKHDKLVSEKQWALNKIISEAYYKNSTTDLLRIRNFIVNGQVGNKKNLLLTIDLSIALSKDDISKVDPKTAYKLKEKISNIEIFDQDSAMLYCNSMIFFDLDTNLNIAKKITHQCIKTHDAALQEATLSIISNMLILCIEKRQFNKVGFLIDSASQIDARPNLFFGKLLVLIAQNAVYYHTRHKVKYLIAAKDGLMCIASAGMTTHARDVEEALELDK